MANITPTPEWSGVYQLETTDDVLAGPDGLANTQAQQLANRTEFLKRAKDATIPTYNSPEAGVDPVTGVAEGAYFNVRSSSDESYIDEYQNLGGSAVATGKSYPSGSYVQNIAEYTALPFKVGKSYAIYERVQLANGDIVINIVDGNTVDPNVDMTGWEKNSSDMLTFKSTTELLNYKNKKDGQVVMLESFHPDFVGSVAYYKYEVSRPKSQHTGGSIIDPNHTAPLASEAWYYSQNTGTGCWVMVNFDNLDIDVFWFGARNDTSIDSPNFDSWGAFDAAFRSAFWNHKDSKVQKDALRRIICKNNAGSTSTGLCGFYCSKTITDQTKGFPLVGNNVTWNSTTIRTARTRSGTINIIWDGINTRAFNFAANGIMKGRNKLLFHFRWILSEYYNLGVAAYQPEKDHFPAILSHQKVRGDNIFLWGVGGPDYAALATNVTVENGKVPTQIFPGVTSRLPSCYGIGLIVDNDITGTDAKNRLPTSAIVSNVNASHITNINSLAGFGDIVYLGLAEHNTSDANGCYFEIANASGSNIGAVLTVSGGWDNEADIRCTQVAFTPFRLLGNFGTTLRNKVRASYVGDFSPSALLAPYMFVDSLTNSAINGNEVDANTIYYPSDLEPGARTTWIEIHPYSVIAPRYIYGQNSVKGATQQTDGLRTPVVFGNGYFAALPYQATLQRDFNQDGIRVPLGDGRFMVEYRLSTMFQTYPVDLRKTAIMKGLDVEFLFKTVSGNQMLLTRSKVFPSWGASSNVFLNEYVNNFTEESFVTKEIVIDGDDVIWRFTTTPAASLIGLGRISTI